VATPRQLALELPHSESFASEDFLRGSGNETAFRLIECWQDWPSHIAALVGPQGCGKSHLAAIFSQASGARVISARELSALDVPRALSTGALVVEDLAPAGFDERGLFHLFNGAREEKASVLLTTRIAPNALPVTIADLWSRLRSVTSVTMHPPDDNLLRALMAKLAADRQMPIDDGVIEYIAARIERSFAAANAAIVRLDQEAMRQQRPASRILAAELFRDM
jgi:chromosomal replication initiation ATPase DnaA